MGKPTISIRKPSSKAQQEFIEGGAAQTASSPKVQTSRRQKPARKQVTVYLSPELAQKLKIEAVTSGKEMSEITEEALQKVLVG